jgi:ribonuclease-3
MSGASDLTLLQGKLGYQFKNIALLKQALTHASMMGEASNERLEFLGDRVLNLSIAHALYRAFPKEAEGSLAKRNTGLVQAKMLATVASEIGLVSFLQVLGGAANENILADAMEAIIGAVFLDGGYEPAENIVLTLWGNNITRMSEIYADPKTELQEWAQGRGLPLPSYEIITRYGPDHAPVFEIELTVKGQEKILATGASRRAAEKEAARLLLQKVKG